MLGIDVSKDTLACTLLDPHTRQPHWRENVPNTPEGVRRLLHRTPAQTPWVLEPTGHFTSPVLVTGATGNTGRRRATRPPPHDTRA